MADHMATVTVSALEQPQIVGRMVWTCVCGHINDMKIAADHWKADCMACQRSVTLLPTSVPRGRPGRSRHHYAVWLSQQR